MSLNPYSAPAAPVAEPAIGAAARWKWLWVPGFHAGFTFFLWIAWWLLEPRPHDAPAASLVREASWLWEWVKDALFQGAVILGTTAVSFWALPRILVRHAAWIGVASAVAGFIAFWGVYLLSGPYMTNGDQLQRIFLTYVAVVLLSVVAIRARGGPRT